MNIETTRRSSDNCKKFIVKYRVILLSILLPLLYIVPLLIYLLVIIKHKNDLIIVLSGTLDNFNSDIYYRAVCPYTRINCVTFDLLYHDTHKFPLKKWNKVGMNKIVKFNNYTIDNIVKKYNVRRLILAGISRGGYLAAMYKNADIYLLFAPVVKWTELTEFTNEGPEIDVENLKTKRVFGYVNKYDYRINGTIVANFFSSICQNCNDRNKKFIVNEDRSHKVPREIFQEAGYWIDR